MTGPATPPDDDRLHGEESIIQEYLAPLAAGYPGAFGLTDDCAAFTPTPGHDLVVKTDPIASGIHFFVDDAPEAIGWKALAVNVSDLVAKAAVPRAYLMALSFPEPPTRAWMRGFAAGLSRAQATFGMHLVGGDTDRRPGPVTISITVFGEVPAGRMLRRGTARAGDLVCVTDTIGDAALGLRLRKAEISGLDVGLLHDDAQHLIDRYLLPRPNPALIPGLRRYASAGMDISDGLLKDLGRMCRASGIGAVLAAEQIPTSAATIYAAHPDLMIPCLTGGDDYAVLCAVPPENFDALEDASAGLLFAIGTFVEGEGVEVRRADGRIWPRDATGWDHF